MKKKILPTFDATSYQLLELKDRIELLEKKVFKGKRKSGTLKQKVLLFHYLGLFDRIYALPISNVRKALLVSILIDEDHSNTKKAMEKIPKAESDLKTPSNFQFLRDLFDEVELNELAAKAGLELQKLEPKKDQDF